MKVSWRARVQRVVVRGSLALPRRLRRRVAGDPLVNDRGDRVDPEVHWLLFLEKLVGASIAGKTVASARQGIRDSVYLVEGPPAAVADIRNETIAGRPCRRYVPQPGLPRLVYLHGGGWTVGDLDTHDVVCRRLAAHGGVEVISVDYRLAPEHPFPCGLEDAVAVFGAVCAERPGPVAMGGDSAGGGLTTAACLKLRDAGERMPDLQLLLYPGTDMLAETPSRDLFDTGFILEGASIRWYMEHYLPHVEERPLPLASPLRGTHEGLPPAILVTAGFDPLRDEGEALGHAMVEAGGEVTFLEAKEHVHGFLAMDGASPSADAEIRRIEQALAGWARSVS